MYSKLPRFGGLARLPRGSPPLDRFEWTGRATIPAARLPLAAEPSPLTGTADGTIYEGGSPGRVGCGRVHPARR